jgi:hypothetical protein
MIIKKLKKYFIKNSSKNYINSSELKREIKEIKNLIRILFNLGKKYFRIISHTNIFFEDEDKKIKNIINFYIYIKNRFSGEIYQYVDKKIYENLHKIMDNTIELIKIL